MRTAQTIQAREGKCGHEALAYALATAETVGGRVANLVEIIEHPDCLYDGKWPYCPLSEEIVGIDRYGRYALPGDVVVVTIHGLGVLTPETLRIAARVGYVGNHSADLGKVFPNQDVLADILNESTLPDNRIIEVLSYDDYKESGLPDSAVLHAVVRTRQQSTYPGHSNIDSLINNPQIITYCGGKSRMSNLFDTWKRKGQGAFGTKNVLSRPEQYFTDAEARHLVTTVANPICGPCDGFYGNWPLSQQPGRLQRYLILPR